MKNRKGFTLVELLVAMSVAVLVTGSAAITLKQVYGGTGHDDSHLAAVQQVTNAGFWITRDAQRAEIINTTNLTGTDLVAMNWTEWDANFNPTYYSVNYTVVNITGNIGKLTRTYWSSNGGIQQTLVGLDIYYNPGDNGSTSKATYLVPVLTVQLTTMVDQARETKQYSITRRPNV